MFKIFPFHVKNPCVHQPDLDKDEHELIIDATFVCKVSPEFIACPNAEPNKDFYEITVTDISIIDVQLGIEGPSEYPEIGITKSADFYKFYKKIQGEGKSIWKRWTLECDEVMILTFSFDLCDFKQDKTYIVKSPILPEANACLIKITRNGATFYKQEHQINNPHFQSYRGNVPLRSNIIQVDSLTPELMNIPISSELCNESICGSFNFGFEIESNNFEKIRTLYNQPLQLKFDSLSKLIVIFYYAR